MVSGTSCNESHGGGKPYQPTQEVSALLAQANLMRIRGDWDRAVALCMDAMSLSPGYSAPQSLLGDIYENRGDIDDAIRWYKMALDSDPMSLSDRRKLERLQGYDGDAAATGIHEPVSAVVVDEPTTNAAGYALPIALRFAAIVCALGIVGLTILAVMKQRSPVTPAAAMAGVSSISAPPILVKPSESTIPVTSGAHASDPGEQSLLDALQVSLTAMNVPVRADDVMSDPRSGAIILTAELTDTSAMASRDTMLRLAATVAVAGTHLQAASAYNTWTVRLLAPDSAHTYPSLAFIGDSQRVNVSALPAELSSATPEQLAALFTNTWWSTTAPQ